MAKNCSHCGKELSFRDSFVWDKKSVCGDCLKVLDPTKKREEISEPQKISDKQIDKITKTASKLFLPIVIITAFFISKIFKINFYVSMFLSGILWFIFRPFLIVAVKFFYNDENQQPQQESTSDIQTEEKDKEKILGYCQDCKYFHKKGIIDKFKGICNLHNKVTYTSFYCSDFLQRKDMKQKLTNP